MITTAKNTVTKIAGLAYMYADTLRKFTFYQIPKTLFEDDCCQMISNDSKLLYGMMLDRAGLSVRNGWTDSAQRVFIYFKMEEAVSKLHVGHNKAVRLYKELETYGMIERKKQGLGKPDQIYVKVFPSKKQPDSVMESSEETEVAVKECTVPARECVEEWTDADCVENSVLKDIEELPYPPADVSFNEKDSIAIHIEYPAVTVQTDDFPDSNAPASLPKMGIRSSAFGKSGVPKKGSLDFPKVNSNNIKKKDKEFMKNQSINLSDPAYASPDPAQYRTRYSQEWINERLKDAEIYREMIHDNIDYDILRQDYPDDIEVIDGYVDLMVEVCCSRRKTYRVNQEEYPTALIKSCFEKLNREHILYVKERMEKNPTRIRNIRAYTLSALFNSYATLTQYYTSQISHDMAEDNYSEMWR